MDASQEKPKKLFQRERERERLQGRREGTDSVAAGAARREKLNNIFQHFDTNGDGRLDRAEMAALIRAANPGIGFTGEQANAIVDAVIRTYCYLLGGDDQHITVDGLLQTCGDGHADPDRDFETLRLGPDDDSRAPPDATATSTASCVSPTSLSRPPPLPPCQRLVAGELDGQNGRLGQQRMNGEGAVAPGADGDGASPLHSVGGEPPSSPASSPPSPCFCSKAKDSDLDSRDHLPSSSELEENGDGPSPYPSVAWEPRPSPASSSSCSEAPDSEFDHRSDHLPQSQIEEIPSFRWLSPSLLPRRPPSNRPESSEVDPCFGLQSAHMLEESGAQLELGFKADGPTVPDDSPTCRRGLMGSRERMVVLKLDLHSDAAKFHRLLPLFLSRRRLTRADDAAMQKARKAVSGLSGIHSFSMDVKDQKITVIGEVDAVHLACSLRKLWRTVIVSSVTAVDPKDLIKMYKA